MVPTQPRPIRAVGPEVADVADVTLSRSPGFAPRQALGLARPRPSAIFDPDGSGQVWDESLGRWVLPGAESAPLSVHPPEAMDDEVLVWSQYYALKALATRLDAGIATERERVAFEAGLREYNANYDRLRAQRKALPD